MNQEQQTVAHAFRPLEITKERHAEFLNFWEEVSFKKGGVSHRSRKSRTMVLCGSGRSTGSVYFNKIGR